MSPHEQRAMMGTIEGWTPSPLGNWPWQMVPPGGDGTRVYNCPNYFNDYHAVRSVEKILMDRGWTAQYLDQLSKICLRNWRASNGKTGKDRALASLTERCEAALRTLGLWKRRKVPYVNGIFCKPKRAKIPLKVARALAQLGPLEKGFGIL